MDTPSIVVPPGRDPGSPGRSFSLKLRGGETGDSIMMFEETRSPLRGRLLRPMLCHTPPDHRT